MFTTAYQRYNENTLLSASPLDIIVTAYRVTLTSVESARECNEMQDPAGRAVSVNKAIQILEELGNALDMVSGGVISIQLAALYDYMKVCLTEGHMEQSSVKLMEVEKLLTTLLSGWQEISRGEQNSKGYGMVLPIVPAEIFSAEPVMA